MSGRAVRWLVAGLVWGSAAVAPSAVGAAAVEPLAVGAQPVQPQRPVVARPVVVQLTAVDAVSADEAWAVGFTARGPSSRTLVQRWDGTSWSVVASPNPGRGLVNRLDGVYVVGPDDVWAVGSFNDRQDGQLHNLAMHWDGRSWRVVSPPDPAPNRVNGLLSVTGSSGSDVWAGGYIVNNDGRTLATLFRWDGTGWSDVRLVHGPVGDPVLGLARFADTYWAVGPCVGGCESRRWRGMVARLKDGKWKDLRTPNLGRTVDADAAAEGDLWTVADGVVSRFDGSTWRRVPNPRIGRLAAVSTPAPGFTLVVAAEAAAVWNGSGWDAVPTPRVGQLLDVDLDSPTSGWAVGSTGTAGLIERWDGNQFQRVAPGGAQASTGVGTGRAICYPNLFPRDVVDQGLGAISQKFGDDRTYTAHGAGDFMLSRPCVVGLVEAFGFYGSLHGPADNETVTFYRNDNGVPGAVLSRQVVQGADFQGDFIIPIRPVQLDAGSYFVSVVAQMDSSTGGWAWELVRRERYGADQWENPSGELSECKTWGDVGTCIGQGGSDSQFLVALRK